MIIFALPALRMSWTDGAWTYFCHLLCSSSSAPQSCCLYLPSSVSLTAAMKISSEASFCSLTLLSSGCRSVPQHHLLQPAVRQHKRHSGGGVPSGTFSRPPWCYPQDAPWLWHPGWRAGPQAVRSAAHLCLLIVCGLLDTNQSCVFCLAPLIAFLTKEFKSSAVILLISY